MCHVLSYANKDIIIIIYPSVVCIKDHHILLICASKSSYCPSPPPPTHRRKRVFTAVRKPLLQTEVANVHAINVYIQNKPRIILLLSVSDVK